MSIDRKPTTRRTLAGSARTTGLLALLAVGLTDCDTTAGGPEYVQLAVIVTPDGGVASPQACLPVPMLPGGRTAKDARFEPGFTVHLEAARDRIDVTFQGIIEPELANRSLPRVLLEDGFSEGDIRVETLDGGRATVLLVAPCLPEDEEGDAGN